MCPNSTRNFCKPITDQKVKHESFYLIQLRSVLQNSSFGSFRLLHSTLGHFEQSTMIRGSQEASYEQNKIKYEDSYAHEWLHHHGHRMMAPAQYIWNYIISVLACTGANVRPSGDSSLAECAWITLIGTYKFVLHAVILSSSLSEHILCYETQLLIMEISRFVPISDIRARNQTIDFFSVRCISFLFVFALMHVFKTECIYFLLFFVRCQRIFHARNSFPLTKPPWAAWNNWKTSGLNAKSASPPSQLLLIRSFSSCWFRKLKCNIEKKTQMF